MMVLNGEVVLVYANGIHSEHVSEFKYLMCVLDESGADRAEYSR